MDRTVQGAIEGTGFGGGEINSRGAVDTLSDVGGGGGTNILPGPDGPDDEFPGSDSDQDDGSVDGPYILLNTVTITASPYTTPAGPGFYAFGLNRPTSGTVRTFRGGTIGGKRTGFYTSYSNRNGLFQTGTDVLLRMRVPITDVTSMKIYIRANMKNKTFQVEATPEGFTPGISVKVIPITVRYNFFSNDITFEFDVQWTIGIKDAVNVLTFNVPLRGWADLSEKQYKIWPLQSTYNLSEALNDYLRGK